jgi:hypothetical protein
LYVPDASKDVIKQKNCLLNNCISAVCLDALQLQIFFFGEIDTIVEAHSFHLEHKTYQHNTRFVSYNYCGLRQEELTYFWRIEVNLCSTRKKGLANIFNLNSSL